MDDLIAVEVARQGAVTGGTHESQARSWRRWIDYIEPIGLGNDAFLDELDKGQRNHIMCCFALALREGRFSKPPHERLASSTVSGAVSYVCTTFRENSRPNPTKDEDLQSSFLLQRLYRAFKNKDPKEKQQKAVPPCVIAKLTEVQITELQIAIAQLSVLGFFFAMRSCEYLKVPQAEKRRTDILRLRNVRFIKDGKALPHDSDFLHLADCVAVTFEMQKKDEKSDTVHHKATKDANMCPVRAAAAIVRRIRNYKDINDNTPISTVYLRGRRSDVTSKQMTCALQDAIRVIGEDVLNIKTSDVGTHSIRSGGAMAMFIGGCPVFMIMLIGRWSSDAFMKYIRKQIEEFSHNVSQKMITTMFHRYIPTIET
jgi:hypothetical protein